MRLLESLGYVESRKISRTVRAWRLLMGEFRVVGKAMLVKVKRREVDWSETSRAGRHCNLYGYWRDASEMKAM